MLMESGLWSPFGGHSWLRRLPGLVSTETDRGNADSVVGLKNTDTLSFGVIKKKKLKKTNNKKTEAPSIMFLARIPLPSLSDQGPSQQKGGTSPPGTLRVSEPHQ